MQYRLNLTIVPTGIDLTDYPKYSRSGSYGKAISCYSVVSFTYTEVLQELDFFASRSIIVSFELSLTGTTQSPANTLYI